MNTYLVGGAVRDRMLGQPSTERDWLVTGITGDALVGLGFKPVGRDFPVFLHPDTHEEYALARTERKTAPGYAGFAFHAAPVFPHIDPARNLTLTTLNLPDQEMCASFAPTFGFALALDGVEVYRDNSIPKSRSCPLDYQIAGIVTTMEEPATRAVAMISVMKVGFEGPDRRLIAVPFSF